MNQSTSISSFWGAEPTFTNLENLSDFLLVDRFTIKDLDVSYTNITYWDKQGILSFNRSTGGKWRNFNFIDFMWIKTVDELRELGVSTKLIKAVKKSLFEPFDLRPYVESMKANPEVFETQIKSFSEQEKKKAREYFAKTEKKSINKKISLFFALINKAIQLTEPIKLEIFKDGSVIIHPYHTLNSEEEILKVVNELHISLSITSILKNFLAGYSEQSIQILTDLKILQPHEINLLELINSGEYDSIKVIFKDSEMNALELSKTQDAKAKLMDIMKEGAYQNITIKSHKGVVSHIENTIKIKL